MSRRNIILLVLLLVLISLSIAFYLYVQNQNLTKSAEQIRQEAVMTELNNFKLPDSSKTAAEITKELESFKIPITTIVTPKTNITTTPSITSTTTEKPKTAESVTKELESFKIPPKNP